MIATIYKSTGSFYLAYDDSGRKWNCRVRGKLKIDQDISSTNPIAVGDQVEISIEDESQSSAIISKIGRRNNYIVRTSPHSRHQKHIVAANIDLALLVATMAEPRTSNGFIDRFLLTAEAYHIPAIIVFNKSDLLAGKSLEEYRNRKYIYEKIGYETFLAAATKGDGLGSFNGKDKE